MDKETRPLTFGFIYTGRLRMENIIKQVIESEYRAQQILAEVEEERRQAVAALDKEIDQVREDIFLTVRRKAEAIKAEKMSSAQRSAEEILSGARTQAFLMQAKYRENRDSWVNSLIERVLDRETQ